MTELKHFFISEGNPAVGDPANSSPAVNRFLRQYEYRDELNSTNDLAMELLTSGQLETPAVVTCNRQTAGRGRGTNRWVSSESNLAFSLVIELPEAIAIEQQLLLSPMVGLVICEVLQDLHSHDQFQIKWPNDVLVCDRKIAGILIEGNSVAQRSLVIGCGINLNQKMADQLVEDQQQETLSAISLYDLTGRTVCKAEVLRRLVERFADRFNDLTTHSERLTQEIQRRDYLSGRTVTVQQGESQLQGECCGISDTGALQIKTAEGIKTAISGTVSRY